MFFLTEIFQKGKNAHPELHYRILELLSDICMQEKYLYVNLYNKKLIGKSFPLVN